MTNPAYNTDILVVIYNKNTIEQDLKRLDIQADIVPIFMRKSMNRLAFNTIEDKEAFINESKLVPYYNKANQHVNMYGCLVYDYSLANR